MPTHDMPMPINTSGDQEECCFKEDLDKLMKDKSVKDIRSMGQYMMDCAYKMSSEMEKIVTMEDFEKRMKDEETAEGEY